MNLSRAESAELTTRLIASLVDDATAPQPGSEAAVTMFTDLTPHIPCAQAVIYDGAPRGVDHQTFPRHLGVLTVSRVAAARRLRNRKGKAVKRVDKVAYVETKTVNTPTSGVDIKLFSRGGQLGLGELTDTGDIAFVPLALLR